MEKLKVNERRMENKKCLMVIYGDIKKVQPKTTALFKYQSSKHFFAFISS